MIEDFEKGYEAAISPKRYAEMQHAWERQHHGARLDYLHKAAPELYLALQALVFALNLEGVPHNQAWDELMAACRAALAKAENGSDHDRPR